MDFSGWEKLSLLDYDDNITTTLFTAGCNFRCPFCHNSSLVLDSVHAPKIAWADIVKYLHKRRSVLDAVCVTGGEPTLMDDLESKLHDIKSLGYKVKLDSNGSRPAVLKKLVSEGLVDYVAMDIKNSPEKYAMTVGSLEADMKAIGESIAFLIHGSLPYEFRTTAIEEYHTMKDFEEIGAWLEGADRYFIQRYVDSENCISHGLHMIPKEKALEAKAIVGKHVKAAFLRGYD
ncbi:MAG: anaerobic ribonucleoside-triphosphate reductase activating protein [Bacilli bacterium]|jgi:pyruvate formate lyase activating enzyme|nr:anaerobic ribonucleoside-triphosphate reductase activating protein [Bacilli bacterium]